MKTNIVIKKFIDIELVSIDKHVINILDISILNLLLN